MKSTICALMVASAATLSHATQATAADILTPTESIYSEAVPLSFAGFYGGLNGGYSWANVSVHDKDGYTQSGGWDFDGGAFAGGGQIGWNRQTGLIVYGVEADLGYIHLLGSDDQGAANGSPGGDADSSISGGFYGALTGRFGVTSGYTLVYAKGGVAFLNADINVDDTCATAPCSPTILDVNGSDTLTGWTAGFGIERMINANWSLKAEYLHFDFGSISSKGVTSALETTRWEHDVTADTVKVGVNYRFGSGSAPLK